MQVKINNMFSSSSTKAKFNSFVFVPVFFLLVSFVFGVASELIGGLSIFLRAGVVIFCLFFGIVVSNRIQISVILMSLMMLIYFCIILFFNLNLTTLNFIFLVIIMFYLHVIRTNQNEIITNLFWASIVVLFLYSLCYLLGYTSDNFTEIGGRVRYSFGFTNANKVGAIAYSTFVITYLYCIPKRSFILFFIVASACVYCAIMSDSRTAILSILIFFILCQLKFIKKLQKMIVLLPLLCLLLSFYIANQSDNAVLNLVLSNRPVDFNDFLRSTTYMNYFVGAPIGDFRVDNSYLVGFFSVGLIGMVVFLFLFLNSLNSAKSIMDLALIVSLLLYGLFESLIVRVEFPIVILFYYLIFFDGKKQDKKFKNRLFG
jgi:hypothetical protein